jgi:hypothetical protein
MGTTWVTKMQGCRQSICWVMGCLAVIIATISLVASAKPPLVDFPIDHDRLGKFIIALWVLLPPLAFWFDWYVLCANIEDPKDRDTIAHTHDLSRNIWLALVVVLTVAFGLKIPGG